ncbi:phospholipase C [Malassezia cuniculi]|uniref:Phospholipase C n=1 Tax=Malassezia cuniculi TaxID=948313 RepID=A0AAF0J5K2_9BASI|nr:phospholipase C [Malassezia cuniculi]
MAAAQWKRARSTPVVVGAALAALIIWYFWMHTSFLQDAALDVHGRLVGISHSVPSFGVREDHGPVRLDPRFDTRAPPQERFYEMNVTRKHIAPDGIPRVMYAINDNFPGPTIEANVGDTVVVVLRNHIDDDFTFRTDLMTSRFQHVHPPGYDRKVLIHWHGLSMRDTQVMDGGGGFTSCPLQPGQEFTYRFKLHPEDVGTHWYHSHSGMSRADGLWGMLVVHARQDESLLLKQYAPRVAQNVSLEWDEEVPVAIGDHFHKPGPEFMAWYVSKWSMQGAEPVPDNGLFNGRNRFSCEHSRMVDVPCPADRFGKEVVGDHQHFRLRDDKRYRLRIVNVGAISDMVFSVDGHTLTVIEADGTLVEPITVHRVPIAPGQRYSVLLNRVETEDGAMPSRVWMRAEMAPECFQYANPHLDYTTRAVLSYSPGDKVAGQGGWFAPLRMRMRGARGRLAARTTAIRESRGLVNVLPQTRPWSANIKDAEVPEEACHDLETGYLLPLVPDPAPELDFEAGDQRVIVYVTVPKLERWGVVPMSYMNSSTWRPEGGFTGKPPLLHRISHANTSTAREWEETGVVNREWELVASPHPSRPVTIELIVNNRDDSPHPFHLHGHKFWVLDSYEIDMKYGGYGDWDGEESKMDVRRVMKRDTVVVPMRGYMRLRWRADNPGVWAFHCHMLVHLASGMAMSFVEMPEVLQATALVQLLWLSLVAAAAAAAAAAEGLKQIEHIVLFMQENRAFDHYFGTMAGVRGFKDANVALSGSNVFRQRVDGSILFGGPPLGVDVLEPFYLNHAGGDWRERTQCMVAGTNKWEPNHEAWHNGAGDQWALKNSPYSIGYLRREDLPVHFALAEGFVVGDAYHEGIISGTNPNRVIWLSGTMNPDGDPRQVGGPLVENSNTPQCGTSATGEPINCMPLRWKTVPERLEEAGISWQIYQDNNSYIDNPLVFWEQYQKSGKDTRLAEGALRFLGLERFLADARRGALPEVSYVVGHQYLTEHPPFTVADGAWLQREVANAVMQSPKYNSTVLIVSYDETGGWADHVMAPHAPQGTAREWMVDPYNAALGEQPIGPGFRVPFYIVSPWTRRGGVFTEVASHESQVLFLEEWARARGKDFHVQEMNPWRRAHMSTLVNAFDFERPDYSAVALPAVQAPSRDAQGRYNGAIACLARFLGFVLPPIPYGRQGRVQVERGRKRMRGELTEGRYIEITHAGGALGVRNGTLRAGEGEGELFVVHWRGRAPGDQRFYMTTARGEYVTRALGLGGEEAAVEVTIATLGGARGYTVTEEGTGRQLRVEGDGGVSWATHGEGSVFELISVT